MADGEKQKEAAEVGSETIGLRHRCFAAA